MTRRVGIVTFDDMTMLDASGPAEVFHQADVAAEHYELVYVSASGGRVVASSGMTLETLPASEVPDLHTVVVAGGQLLATRVEPEVLDAVERVAAGADRVAAVCTGAFVLAELGFLDGRRATTHWRHAPVLAARFPEVEVEPDVIYLRDGRYLTSAGISAGIDLALAMVEEDLGVEVARETARELVMFMQRPGGQSQFSTALRTRPVRDEPLRAALEAVVADPGAPHTTVSMATSVGVSPRHLNRLFRDQVGSSPARWLEQVRVDAARPLVLEGRVLTQVAQLVGLGSDETLRRAFLRQLGTTPSAYRERFATTRPQRV